MPKHFNLLAFAIVVAFVSLTASVAYGAYVCGDANGDGNLNVSDAVFIINYVFAGGLAPDPNCCGPTTGTVTDIDGNVYQTIKIGDQWWMAENLKVAHYSNGDPIPNVTDGPTWAALTTGAYCSYNNDEGYVAVYGRLYNWYAAIDGRSIAPAGWHVASDAEWQTLSDYLGGDVIAGGKMKEPGTAHWNSPNIGATNESGFTALPGGYRFVDGYFFDMGSYAYFWSSTEYDSYSACARYLSYHGSGIGRFYGYKHFGYSVRCVKD